MSARRWPFALVALVATIGTAACKAPPEPAIAPSNPVADSADQTIFGARQLLTDQGLLRARLHADTAFFLNEGTRIELRQVNTEFFNATGAKSATLTSREGTYNTQIGQMAARKNVVVVSEDGRRLTTQELRFNEQTNLISSDSAFVVTQGERRLEGVGFETDPNMNSVRCKAACRGELGAVAVPQTGGAPAAAPGRGSRPNTFVLPGQPVAPPVSEDVPTPGAPRIPPAQPPEGTTPTPPTPTPPAPATPPPTQPPVRR